MDIELKIKLDDEKELVLTEEQAKEVYTKLGQYFSESTSSVPANTRTQYWPYYSLSRLFDTQNDLYKWKINIT
ncbi:MAG TPA: hypothetical protein VLB82_12925 [Thermodesulfobacteriota bacterium]|nr:hypothetical protein [Thermodesulfobacteriota bacterium]